jgi:transcriptional regulator with XRE-family HTH domain
MPPERRSDDFGSVLKEARERRGIGLRQIADDTKISVRALEALERNDISQLPGGIFSRAFVRAYASQIGLDPEETVESFLRHFPHDSVTVGHPPTMRIDFEAALNAGPVRVLWPWAAAGAAIVVAAILFLLSRR